MALIPFNGHHLQNLLILVVTYATYFPMVNKSLHACNQEPLTYSTQQIFALRVILQDGLMRHLLQYIGILHV